MGHAGLPRTAIEDVGGCVTACFLPTRHVTPQRVVHALTDRQRALLALLVGHGGLALRCIRMRGVGQATQWAVNGDVPLLRQTGLVESTGWGRGAYWRFPGKVTTNGIVSVV